MTFAHKELAELINARARKKYPNKYIAILVVIAILATSLAF